MPSANLTALFVQTVETPLFLWVYLATSVKRLHDRDKSGWWIIAFFVLPCLYGQFGDRVGDWIGLWGALLFGLSAFVFSVWGFVEMYCLKGSRKTNRFGPDPLAPRDTRPGWDQQSRDRNGAAQSVARRRFGVLSRAMNDAVSITRDLVRCPSVTPADAGALGVLENLLKAAGFEVHRVTFGEPGTADIDNLYARIGDSAPHISFAGHTDVVPAGDEAAWSHGAFSGEVRDGFLYGRGAVDMKGGIACSVAAVLQYLADHGGKPKGSISFLITGDEEDISVNGTIKLLQWVAARGEKFDHCVLGEPSNVEVLGDCIKVGRRGSQSGTLFVDGVQGHVAYPHRAANPVPDISRLIVALERGAARSWQRAIPGVQPGIHLGRCRQHREQRDPGAGAREIQHPLQRQPQSRDAPRAGRRTARQGLRQPHPRADRMAAVELQRVRDKTRCRSPISPSAPSKR